MKKRIWKVICLGMAVTMLNGCGSSESKYREMAQVLLKEKYGEEFQIQEYWGRDWSEDSFEVCAYAEEEPEILFEAEIACDGSYISDDYVTAKICRRLEETVKENLSQLPGYLEVKASSFLEKVKYTDPSMSVKEFVNLIPNNSFDVYVYFSPMEGSKELYQILSKAMNNMGGIDGSLHFYSVEEEKLKEIQEYLTENAKLNFDFQQSLDAAAEITIPFEDGSFQMTEDEFNRAWGENL